MISSVNTQQFLIFILIFFRLTAFIYSVPVFFPIGIPQRYKVGIGLMLALIFMPIISGNVAVINDIFIFIIMIFKEILVGLLMGFILNLIFNVTKMAGQFLDIQASFAMSSVFDPISNEAVTIIGRIFYFICLMVFLLIDGHHLMIKALTESFKVVSLGTFTINTNIYTYMIHVIIEFFNIGVKIAVPIILIIIITDFTLGLVAKVMPQLNIMIFGLPLKILIGLGCISLSLPMLMKIIVNNFGIVNEAIKGLFTTMPCIFIFFANDSGDKTEEATPKKKEDARKKGQVAKSKELTSAIALLGTTLIISKTLEFSLDSIRKTFIMFLNNYSNYVINASSIKQIIILVVIRISVIVLPIALPIMFMGIIGNVVQVGKMFSTEPLKPKLEKINPISGFKRMFSIKSLMELIKNIAIIIIIGYVGYKFILSQFINVLNYGNLKPEVMMLSLGTLIVKILYRVTLIMLIIGIVDFVYQKFQFKKDLKMSKQEVKEEFKEQEGDPIIKGKRRQKQRELAMRRMMQSVPDATVVITNPTHIAVALKYEENTGTAPKVIAKGADSLAIKIKEIAKNNEVPIIENKPLARLIYSEVDLDKEIPYEMYQAVAEILAIVYKLNKKK